MNGANVNAKSAWSPVTVPVATYPAMDMSALVAKTPPSVERATGP